MKISSEFHDDEMVSLITFMVVQFITFMGIYGLVVLLHLWLKVITFMVSVTFMVNFYYIYGWYYIYGFYYIYG